MDDTICLSFFLLRNYLYTRLSPTIDVFTACDSGGNGRVCERLTRVPTMPRKERKKKKNRKGSLFQINR